MNERRERVFIALGTNIEPRAGRLQQARQAIAALPRISRVAESPVYETEPWGVIDQGMFLNQVVEVTYEGDPDSLLDQLKKLEESMGRKKREKWGPREIDLDILAFGRRQIDSARLTLPHAGLAGRSFVLGPWRDIAPDWRHPVTGKTIEEMWDALDRDAQTSVRRADG
jgi:2-amino-4-hydroxy-6-hydroxymethyldihydropteridine diphosphokinase